MRSVAGNGLGTTVGSLTSPWGITMVILGVILGVILRVAYVILLRKVALSEQIGRDLIFWKCLPCNVIDSSGQ